MKKVVVLIFFSSIPILYLCTHNFSFRMTRQITDMEEEIKMLTEQLEQYKIEAAKALSYSAMETKALGLGLTFTTVESLTQINLNTSVTSDEKFKENVRDRAN